MERRSFLKLTFGFIAGASALAAGAEAAPLPPVTPQGQGLGPRRGDAEPAIAGQDDVDGLAPDQVQWRHWGYRRRRFRRYRRRYWRRRRYWGWPRWRWPRFHWRWHRRRFWRRRYWW
ncbi:twin-arginine translocation (Tat) [Bradyrhizobium sp.]